MYSKQFETNRNYNSSRVIVEGGIDMLDEQEINKIRKVIEQEFPNDIALQQIHIARKIIAREAEMKGLKYLDYIKILTKDIKTIQ